MSKILGDLNKAEGFGGSLLPVKELACLAWELRGDGKAAAAVINGQWELAKDRLELRETYDETLRKWCAWWTTDTGRATAPQIG